MKTKTTILLCLLAWAIAFSYSIWLYPTLPQLIPTHWDINGNVNGWGDKNWALFTMPALTLLMTGLLLALPWMSPKNFKIDSFRTTYNEIMFVIVLMFLYCHFVITYGSAHPQWDLTKALVAGIMGFLGLLGNFLGRVQKNFYVGIRTPWTLASDQVWVATHRVGARLMFGSGFVGAILVILGMPALLAMGILLIACLYPILYSLLLYKKLERNHAL